MSITPPKLILPQSPVSSTLINLRINSQPTATWMLSRADLQNIALSWFSLYLSGLSLSLLSLSCSSVPLHRLPDILVLECSKTHLFSFSLCCVYAIVWQSYQSHGFKMSSMCWWFQICISSQILIPVLPWQPPRSSLPQPLTQVITTD